jgi:general secretion pathway protein G
MRGRHPGRRWAGRSVRGFNLLEIMIVVAIISLLTTAVALGVTKWKRGADASISTTSADTLRRGVIAWRLQHGGDDCPTRPVLIRDGVLDEGQKARDAWGTPLAIECDGERVRVRSCGPDRKPGTADDLVVPAPEDGS